MRIVPKILIVDDKQRMCESLKTILNHHGYDVFISNSGEKALEYLSENEFDLVLLDIVMPSINGFVVLKKTIFLCNLTGRKNVIVISCKLLPT